MSLTARFDLRSVCRLAGTLANGRDRAQLGFITNVQRELHRGFAVASTDVASTDVASTVASTDTGHEGQDPKYATRAANGLTPR